MAYAIGIDVGGTNVKITAVSKTGEALCRVTGRTADDRGDWIERIREQIAAIETEQETTAEWIGFAAPGLAAADGRSIAWMQGRMECVQGLDWTAALGLSRTAPVLNDAHAALLGEVWRGAAAGSRNVMLLTLGTGIGGGALVDGRLLAGSIGRGGHFGHICLDPDGAPDIVGTPGSLEDAIGECTLLQRSGGRFATTEELIRAHRAGDAEASQVWLRSVQRLACGITSLINVLDPETVIIGGGIARAGAALFDPLQGFLDAMEWRPTGSQARILPAALGEWAGAVGAAHHVLRQNGEIG